MSNKAKVLDKLYKLKKVSVDGVSKALSDGIITNEEYNIIVGQGGEI